MNAKWLLWGFDFFTKLIIIRNWYLGPHTQKNITVNNVLVGSIIGISLCTLGILLNTKEFKELNIIKKIIASKVKDPPSEFTFLYIRLILVESCGLIGLFLYSSTKNNLLFFSLFLFSIAGWLLNIPINKNADKNLPKV